MSCSFLSCVSQKRNKEHGISFHRFPADEFLKRAWVEAVDRKNWTPTRNSFICSKHFKKSDFEDKNLLRCSLKLGAIPSKEFPMELSTNMPIEKNSSKCFSEQGAGSCCTKKLPVELSTNLHEQPCQHPDELMKVALMSIENVNLKRKLQKPNEVKYAYYKKIKSQEQIIQKQGKKINDLLKVIESLKANRFIDQSALEHLNAIAAPNKELILRQLSTVTDIVSPKQYSPQLRAFALTLHFYSPAAYDYVRETFKLCLPHRKTIAKWYQHIDASPGFTEEAMNLLRHASKITPHTIICSLVIDEMAIREHVEWDGHKFHGYVDVGIGLQEGDNLNVATNAFVFMVVGINCRWKIPVGYFLVDRRLPTEQRCNLIKQCLILLHETGIKVVSLTCDGLASNISAAKELGCDFSINDMKTTFKHPETEDDVAFILDPCHMLKLVRNTLGHYKSAANQCNKLIRWDYISKLQEFQDKEGLKLANKLTKYHINFYTQKMKVKLASQLLSSSVADTIKFYNEDLKLEEFKGSEATVEFIRNFNDLFDILNSRNLKHSQFKKPINSKNECEILKRLNELYIYISNLKVAIDGPLLLNSQRKCGFLGFLICIKSMLHLYKTLVKYEAPLLQFLPMYKFNQDHLEMFFSQIRSHCGYNNNPTARQFRSAYRKLLVKSEIKHSKASNCIALEDITILNIPSCTEPIDIINASSARKKLLEEEVDFIILPQLQNTDHDYLPCPGSLNEFSSRIVEYIAGYIAKQLINSINCINCITVLTSNISNCQISLIAKKDKGGLKYPSEDVFKICKRCEQIFRIAVANEKDRKKISLQALSISLLKSFQGDNIFSALDVHMHDTSPLENHSIQLIRAIAKKYYNIRLFSHSKSLNQVKTYYRNLYNKSVLFKGQ